MIINKNGRNFTTRPFTQLKTNFKEVTKVVIIYLIITNETSIALTIPANNLFLFAFRSNF